MSTFKGAIPEFPGIQVDYFRTPQGQQQPRACFASHIHTDHLQGLEGFWGGNFIHCSAATKELLVRLQRRMHRVNWENGRIEAQECRYRQLASRLKVLPLETPTHIELGLNETIRVTAFDANHCVGAVMFLLEGGGKAVLYTGDIRAEPWWVEYIARHPVMVPYTTGMKRLDNIYLDTSCAHPDRVYDHFPSRRDGLRELFDKLARYPIDTIFHFNAWTFGFEEVWVALAAAFGTEIHVGKYIYNLYRSVRPQGKYSHGPYLAGHEFGNSVVDGILTQDPSARIHSCEKGLDCPALKGKNVVWIRPIVTRVKGVDISEAVAESGDLESQDDLALNSEHILKVLEALGKHLGSNVPQSIRERLTRASASKRQSIPLVFAGDAEELDLPMLLEVLAKAADRTHTGLQADVQPSVDAIDADAIVTDAGERLPRRVSFPYARHSSCSELRYFLSVFRPRDVYACTVVEDWTEECSMERLFGDVCPGAVFSHDKELRENRAREHAQSQLNREREEALQMSSQQRRDGTQEGSQAMGHSRLTRGSRLPGPATDPVEPALQEKADEPCSSPPFPCADMTAASKQLLNEGNMPWSDGSTTECSSPVQPVNRSFVELSRPFYPTVAPTQYRGAPAQDSSNGDTGSAERRAGRETLGPVGEQKRGSGAETPLRPVKRRRVSIASGEERPLQQPARPRSSRRALSSTMVAFGDVSGDSQESLDADAVEEAELAALGVGGASWWTVGLESTRTSRTCAQEYENDVEL